MKNYLDACKRRKEETGESGFSLIELIVVVILGVLALIAVPVFIGLQESAEDNSVKTVAANGASQIAAAIANGETVTSTTIPSPPPSRRSAPAPTTTSSSRTVPTRSARASMR